MTPTSDPIAAVTVPNWIEIFPELAFAALKLEEPDLLVAHALLRAWDREQSRGTGLVPRPAARMLIAIARSLQRRQTERTLARGDGSYWELIDLRVRLHSLGRVAETLGVARVGRGHVVPVDNFGSGIAALRAALLAVAYRTDDQGTPLTRRLLREITGIPESTQRLYDRRYGNSELVRPVWVEVSRPGTSYARGVAQAQRHLGFYPGTQGALLRRHGNIRRAAAHRVASIRASRRLNKLLRGNDRPAMKARGHRPLRAYFLEREGGLKGWTRATRALGKGGTNDVVNPLLDYSLVETKTRRGRKRWEVVREQS